MTNQDPNKIRVPRQARSAQTLTKVLDACDVLLVDRAFEQISMQDIAREAGVSVGNLYNRFRDRDALIEHIMERHQQQFREYMEGVLSDHEQTLSLSERVSVVAETLNTGLNNLRPVFASLVMRRTVDLSVSGLNREATDAIIDLAVEWICRSDDEIPENAAERARFAIASLAFGLQFNLLLGTATRMFGESYLDQVKSQAYYYLIHQRD